MATQNIKAFSANRAEIKFDGKVIGILTGVTCNDSYNPEPVSGIGDIHSIENVPTRADHRISAETMVLHNESMRRIGIAPENGDDILKGMVFDIAVYSKAPFAGVQRTYSGCSFASGSSSIRAHAIVVSSAEFVALDVTGKGL